jgi:hemolysin-activating ACP:hemolysin acyltransferase
MLITSSKVNQLKFVDLLIKKHKLNNDQSLLLTDIVSILPVCKNNYNHYGINEIESFFVFPLLLDQQISLYDSNSLKGFITYAKLGKNAERSWLKYGQIIKFDEWNSGENIWIIDALTPWGHGRAITTKLEEHLSKLGYKGKIIRYKRNYANGKTRFNQSII